MIRNYSEILNGQGQTEKVDILLYIMRIDCKLRIKQQPVKEGSSKGTKTTESENTQSPNETMDKDILMQVPENTDEPKGNSLSY